MFTVCVYNNNEYKYLKNCIRYEEDEVIVTRIKEDNKEKVFEDFRLSKSGTVYYRPVSREELTDIFTYDFVVGIGALFNERLGDLGYVCDENCYKEITRETFMIESNRPYGGDGWENIDRDLWVKRVKYSEMSGAVLRLKYQKKDGVEYDPPLVIEKDIETEEIYKYYRYYEEL